MFLFCSKLIRFIILKVHNYVLLVVGQFDSAMECRKIWMLDTLEGLQRTTVPLVGYSSGGYYSAGYSDDIGIYYWTSQIAQLLNISVVESYNYINIFLFFLSFVLAFLGVLLSFDKIISKLFGVCLLLFFYLYWLPTVLQNIPLNYITSLLCVISFVPLSFYFIFKVKKPLLYSIFLLFAGFIIGNFHFIRSFSPLSTIVILTILIISNISINYWQKIGYFSSLVVGIMIACLLFNNAEEKRDRFLEAKIPNYNHSLSASTHPFWHSAYIGLGYYINNPFNVSAYSDSVAAAAVKNVDPNAGYFSFEYEQILKKLYIKTVSEYPLEYIVQLFKKAKEMFNIIPFSRLTFLGIVICMLLGVLSFFNTPINYFSYLNKRKIIMLNIAFIFSLGASLLTALLVIPFPYYASDFFSIIYIYAAIGMCQGFYLLYNYLLKYKIFSLKIK